MTQAYAAVFGNPETVSVRSSVDYAISHGLENLGLNSS
jgi:hypothetical protein